jgi:hypothetical protein
MLRLARMATACTLAALVTVPTVSASAQARGRDLYDLMGRERLITAEGTSLVRWAPDAAYFVRHRKPETAAIVP